jgi:hypothetical protein
MPPPGTLTATLTTSYIYLAGCRVHLPWDPAKRAAVVAAVNAPATPHDMTVADEPDLLGGWYASWRCPAACGCTGPTREAACAKHNAKPRVPNDIVCGDQLRHGAACERCRFAARV